MVDNSLPFWEESYKEGELLTIYKDWEIIDHKEIILEDEHPGAPKHYHAINKIVARKIRMN